MRLIRVEIDGYKHLKKTCVNFNNKPVRDILQDELPIRFFIGLNGSGKSVFLEAVCFLFSRIVQDEVPGFDFSLVYSIQREVSYRVEVKNGSGIQKLHILVWEDGKEEPETLFSFAGHRYLLPDYVFTCASGNNNSFFDIMMSSPKTSLYSDLFDLSLLGSSKLQEAERKQKIDMILNSLRILEENPICMFIDEKNSVLALAAFFAIFPAVKDGAQAERYIRCRREILSMLDHIPRPVSLSLVLDAKRFQESGEQIKQYGAIFNVGEEGKSKICDWDTIRLYQDEVVDADDSHGDRVLTFLFEPYEMQEGIFYIPKLTEAYGDPMEFLSKLVLARNKGIIKESHLSFQIPGIEDILQEDALSEGEYMLLVRLGLLALGRQEDGNSQCLFLLDEPDVYLNEHWDIDFVSKIHQIYAGSKMAHEIVIATHSSLMLTDAFPEQLYYFQQKDGGVRCYNIRASTFGGSRNEIMQALFRTNHTVGSYSYSKLEKVLEEVEDIEQLESYLDIVGSGYLRLRLLDKIQIMRKREG